MIKERVWVHGTSRFSGLELPLSSTTTLNYTQSYYCLCGITLLAKYEFIVSPFNCYVWFTTAAHFLNITFAILSR